MATDSVTSFTLVVSTTPDLPTVLTAVALKVPRFTVEDDRAGNSGGWLIRIVGMPQPIAADILESLRNYTSIYTVEKYPTHIIE